MNVHVRRHLTVSQALKRVDSEAVLFFVSAGASWWCGYVHSCVVMFAKMLVCGSVKRWP